MKHGMQTESTLHSGRRGEVRTDQVDISVVLVSYNSRDFLEKCFTSLYSAQLAATFETILVDNGSTDDTVRFVASAFPQVSIIRSGMNRGFAAASNEGIRAGSGRYVLLLNCDTVVNGPSIDAMVEFLDENCHAAAAGGILLNQDGSFQSGASRFSSLLQELLIASHLGAVVLRGYPSYRVPRRPTEVDWLSAACLLVRRDVFPKVGYLDEQYFMYSEEVDWQFRFRQLGMKVYFLPHVSTIHCGGSGRDRWSVRKMVYRGKILFYKKNYGRVKELVLRCLLASVTLAKLLLWGVLRLCAWNSMRPAKELRSNAEVLAICLRPC